MTISPRRAAWFATVTLAVIAGLASWSLLAATAPTPADRAKLEKQLKDGNFKDAYEGFQRLALAKDDDPRKVGHDLQSAIQCLVSLGREVEIDGLLDKTVAMHKDNWRLLRAAAQSYLEIQHWGYLVAQKFYRGSQRGGGSYVDAFDRDRVRSLQLFRQAFPLIAAGVPHTSDKNAEADAAEIGDLYLDFAAALASSINYRDAWRLQVLTDIDRLPDCSENSDNGDTERGAPVDEAGNPIFYTTPKSWNDAANDGQRWRWALSEAAKASPAKVNAARLALADFLQSQFDVETVSEFASESGRESPFSFRSLGEDETIARLATGIKQFKLPDEFNFIKIYQAIAANPKGGLTDAALERLAQVFEGRRQFPKAATYWRRAIKQFGRGKNNYRQERLKQIVGSWGRFESTVVQPAGQGASLQFKFRNGRHVSVEAHRIKVDKLLDDVRAYIRSSRKVLNQEKIDLQDIGYRLVTKNQKQYLAEKTAAWELDLDPPQKHFDRTITVATPLQKAGAYLLKAKMRGGNTSSIVVWVADTAIVEKPLSTGELFVVADAVTGKPIPHMNVELFLYHQDTDPPNRGLIITRDFAEFSNAAGEVIVDKSRLKENFNLVAIARSDDGRLAYLGFNRLWNLDERGAIDHQYNEVKAFAITDRPVYRPGQKVKFKFWVRRARYDQSGGESEFASQKLNVQLDDPKSTKIYDNDLVADRFGGISDEFALSPTATLGEYNFKCYGKNGGEDVWYGEGSFRVEEYKKPEFEVTVDAPSEPISLGEKTTAKIKAKYYFGSPITNAEVHYKVLRTGYSADWFPPAPWDWLFGSGYWWFGGNYSWFPGWSDWGFSRRADWWSNGGTEQPEVVADAEQPIARDGTLSINIDTAPAKAAYPDQDERYEITAEVTDASRRTIVGTGTVLVARQPFQVTAWLDNGYYHTGDEIVGEFAGRTLDGKPVKGTGHAVLYKITYPAATSGKATQVDQPAPTEKAVEEWNVDTAANGMARQTMKAGDAGQYRISYKLTDAKHRTIEGAYIFTVIGPDFTGVGYRFNDLELIPDRREYAAGDHVKLLLNTNRADASVWLFLRPADNQYLPPRLLHLDGKSTVIDVGVTKRDMPNFFVEALTISHGKAFSELRQIVVPPEKRILDVAVHASKAEYRPGEKAKVDLRLMDLSGKPFVGTTVVAIYDKALEYISSGSNVRDIKSFFWIWQRSQVPQQQTNLGGESGNLSRDGDQSMADLGIIQQPFVTSVVPDSITNRTGADFDSFRGLITTRAGIGGGIGGFGGGMGGGGMGGGMGGLWGMRGESITKRTESYASVGAPSSPSESPRLVQPTIRKNFADTALWVGSLETNERGEANVALVMPENLTTWRIKVWGMGDGTRVGEGSAEVVTRKNLIVRLEASRFFVEKDEVVLSANVHNYLKTKKVVRVSLELPDGHLVPMSGSELTRQVEVPAGGESRVDWRVRVAGEGQTTVRMKALTDEESDATEQQFPVYVHGMSKMEAFSGSLRPDANQGKIVFNVPAERRPGDSVFEVRYSPTLAGAMVDALPYLANYPYGCTEQTLNRFLPTVVTQKILQRMGLDLKQIQQKRTNLNAQELGDAKARSEGWKHYDRNPVFDNDEVTRMVESGVERLQEMQNADGGWGWFSGAGEQSWPHTTATVVHGLELAQANDVAIVPGVLEHGIAWLKQYQDQQVTLLQNALVKPKPRNPYKISADNIDALVYMVLVDARLQNPRMMGFLYRDRVNLAVYAKALFGLALAKLGDQKEKLAMILQNIRQFVGEDNENQTAYLKLPANEYWWFWYGSEVEANAYYLKLLTRTDPKGAPAPRLVKYLLNNRKNADYWSSTRDTALAIEALADYLRASGEDRPDETIEVVLDGKLQKKVHVAKDNLFTFDNKFVLRGDAVTTGRHTLELRKIGAGPLYYNAYLTTFTLQDWIPRAGLEVRVDRHVYKLERDDATVQTAGGRGQAVGERVEHYKRTELKNLDTLRSGDLVEVEFEIDSKNDYEYIIFEDMKVAGFEPVDLQSGYNGNALGAYMELRDNRVTFFVHELPRGKHSVSYRLRAEIPGQFSALPARAAAMYAPELKANSDEIKVRIGD